MALTAAYDLQIKILMIGDSGVGKTCLLLRYTSESFSPTFITTIGIDFKVKTIRIENKNVKLQVWDTAGQERFRTITTSYFRGAQGILLVYDVTDRNSFENVKTWMNQIHQHAAISVNKILIGNKCDADKPESPMKRVVSKQEGNDLAQQYGIQFFETSAKSDINVSSAFVSLATQVVKRLDTENEIKIKGENTKEKKNTNGGKRRGLDLSSVVEKHKPSCCN